MVYCVSPSLTTCQVDETHLALWLLVTVPLELQLQDGMRSGAIRVCPSYSACSRLQTVADSLHD